MVLERRHWIFAAVVGLVVAARLYTVVGYHVPAVDGRQYLALAEQLRDKGRLAFSAREAPTYSRLPGYPLFLAVVAARTKDPTLWATVANVFCDLSVALLLGWWLARRAGERAAAAGVLLLLTCPLLLILCSHALTETFATALGVGELVLAFGAATSGSFALALGAGLLAGAGQLTRGDAITVVPAALLAIALGRFAPRRRLQQAAVFLAGALVIYGPWPARNLAQFGKPYPFAWQWRTAQGRPLPTGVVRWARTWTRADPSEYNLDPLFAFEQKLPSPLPQPYAADDADERARLKANLDRYNRERLSPAVDAEFEALAALRWERHPLKVALRPFARIPALFRSVPSGELSINAPLFGVTARRPWVAYYDLLIYLAAAVGLLRLARRDRRTAAVFGVLFGARVIVLAATVPLGISQRHLVEVFPWLVVLAVLAVQGARAPSSA